MELLKRLHIKRPDRVLDQYSRWDHERFCKLIEIDKLLKDDIIQYGGEIIEEKFNGYPFKIFVQRTKISVDIAVHPDDNNENAKYCIHIKVHKDDDPLMKLAYIDNISYYPNCTKIGLEYPGGGSILVKFAIYLIKNIKGLNISKVRLRDTSSYKCGGKNGKNMNLALMYSLTHGDTWYGKFGFRPYDIDNIIITKDLINKYENNIKIAHLMVIDRLDILKKYFGKDMPKSEFRENFGYLKIGKFIEKFVKKYDEKCEWFSQNYVNLAKDLDVHNFSQNSFELII